MWYTMCRFAGKGYHIEVCGEWPRPQGTRVLEEKAMRENKRIDGRDIDFNSRRIGIVGMLVEGVAFAALMAGLVIGLACM